MMLRPTSFPPFASPVKPETSMPSIDEFLDELPPIEDFVDFGSPEVASSEPSAELEDAVVVTESPTPQIDGWAPAEFQSYDWESLAALNRSTTPRQSADESWSDTDWPAPGEVEARFRAETGTSPSANEVADALDGIARRIRSGELMIENLYGGQPEAAMAAALAIILRMRG
jgi:hypothetical protein